MELNCPAIPEGHAIPERHAFGVFDAQEHARIGANVSPALTWSEVPSGTLSFALLCVDIDVPTVLDRLNQEGHVLPADMPRQAFYHWVLIDIPGTLSGLEEGLESEAAVPHGKPGGKLTHGLRGKNDYTGFMAQNPDMQGDYHGYDGPWPPWNDARLHHYQFRLYALNIPSLGLTPPFDGRTVHQRLEQAKADGQILAQAQRTGTYTLHPPLRS